MSTPPLRPAPCPPHARATAPRRCAHGGALFAALAALALAACAPEEDGPEMAPGANCMTCHRAGAAANDFAWTVAGTAFATTEPTAPGLAGARVLLADTKGRALELTTNAAGNFYTEQAMTPPLHVAIEQGGRRRTMSFAAPSGACGTCHGVGGSAPMLVLE